MPTCTTLTIQVSGTLQRFVFKVALGCAPLMADTGKAMCNKDQFANLRPALGARWQSMSASERHDLLSTRVEFRHNFATPLRTGVTPRDDPQEMTLPLSGFQASINGQQLLGLESDLSTLRSVGLSASIFGGDADPASYSDGAFDMCLHRFEFTT